MFDLFIFGGGPAGYVAAIRGAQLGLSVALAEERALGGTCLNRGCVPTKALLHAAEAYRSLSALDAMGIGVQNPTFDYRRIHEYKDRTVTALRDGVDRLLKANGVTVFPCRASVAAPGRVRVGAREEEAKSILVATGSAPSVPPIPGSEDGDVFTSDRLLCEPERFYPRLVIIGGGVIGMETACIYSALGCRVTVLEAMPRVLPMMDREISQSLTAVLKKRGVTVCVGARVGGITRTADGLCCAYTDKNGDGAACGDGVLISIGRRPNTRELFAETCTPEMAKGFLQVDGRYQTSVPGIYAVGDCNGKLQLAHAAEAQARACVEYLCGQQPSIDPDVVPSCVYTDPEIGCVGLTEAEAKERGIPVTCGKHVMNGNARTLIQQADRSFVKLVFHAESGALLGTQLMCPRATDLISELTCAVVNGLTAAQLLASLRAHPTFAEAITEAVEAARGGAIHELPRRPRA